MTKQATRFKKGDKVYLAATNVSSLYINGLVVAELSMVIERTIDSCGKQRMTFADNGNDYAFGKSISASASNYFKTSIDAAAYLKSRATSVTTIEQSIYSDQKDEWLVAAKEWKAALT